MLKVIGFVFVCAVYLGHTRASTCSMTNPCQLTGGAAFVEPEAVKSSEGSLSYTLQVNVTKFTFDWLTVHRRVYNGKIAGPTITVRQGDNINITVMNNLDPMQKTGPEFHNQMHSPNSTNLHTHGLHISSTKPADDVFLEVLPGGNFTHIYHIDPHNPAGTYWYHAHLHGATMFQVQGGMSGMLIVEDPDNGTSPLIKSVSCPSNCEHDIELLYQPTLQYADIDLLGFGSLQSYVKDSESFRHRMFNVSGGGNLEDWLKDINNGIDYYTTNGLLQPHMTIQAGQIKRFRMVNAGGLSSLELTITDDAGVTACDFYEIAIDGVYFNAPRRPKLSKSFLVPAARIDWLVVCNKPGRYKLVSIPEPSDAESMGYFVRFNNTLLTLQVNGVQSSTVISTSLPSRPHFVKDFTHLTENEVHGHFVIEANSNTHLNRELFKTPDYYRYKIEVGKVQQWYLINTDHRKGHPMHIHINHFQIISYNKYTGAYSPGGKQLKLFNQKHEPCHYQYAGYNESINIPPNRTDGLKYLGHDIRANGNTTTGTLGYSEIGDFRDVVLVPPLANITIRFLPDKYIGKKTIHCHILVHEDSGMMYVVDVVNQGESLEANVKSGNAYAGTCDIGDPFPFNKPNSGDGGLSGGAIAGIVIGSFVGVILLLGCLWLLRGLIQDRCL